MVCDRAVNISNSGSGDIPSNYRPGLVSPSDGPITINADNSLGGVFAKPPVSLTEDDLAKAENFTDNAYMEVILDANKSPYSNLVKDIEADYESQLTQLSLLLKKCLTN